MKKRLFIGLGLFVCLLLGAWVSMYPDWLWFENLGFAPVFWTMLLSKFGSGLVVWLTFILIVGLNLYVATRLKPVNTSGIASELGAGDSSQHRLSGKTLILLLTGLFMVVSFIVASKGSFRWDTVLRYIYRQPFGSSDPIFNRDIGFYVFTLPLYLLVQNGLLVSFVLAGLISVGWYMKDGIYQIMDKLAQPQSKPVSLPRISIAPRARKHLILLAGIIVLILAWGFYLKMYGLMYSTQGPAFGASYTDIHIKVMGFKVLIFASLGLALMLFYNFFKPGNRLILVSGGVWLGAVLVFAVLLPILVQTFVVKPNELAKESRYISYNIDYTRKAYNLDKIKEIDFTVNDKLSAEDIKEHNATIQNIRIWDERPLLQTYRQIQSIRLYYDFINVDVDRYLINKKLRQVMLAARELVINQLPPQANTWVNRHLIYTHGYGLAASLVNEVTDEGLPRLLIKDLPPSFDADLKIERPEIYYAEMTDNYVLVNTKLKEFDYPKGDKNVYTSYQGSGGVHIKSFARRLLFALKFRDLQILFTGYLGPESRIMYNRRINRRVDLIAPFLDYDGDPYIVVSGGKLYWIQDAYTTSDMYPYSRRIYGRFKSKGLNYIRNSVKVTIDAYNGEVSFYIIDERDPVVKTYSRIFPDLFKPFSEMPADLKKHIRYPKDLFKIQVDIYKTYHMEDVQVFYNQEDLWGIPDELYGDSRQEMEPYYIIIKLPEENKEEFLLMLPFTPSKKDNMIGWLAARSDLPNYGNLLIYKLSKEKLIFGPMQIEARVDQQTDISRELSLWGQGGSRVIRGNLLVIPLGNSFIYVEPVYLEARQEEGKVPSTGSPQPEGAGKSQQREAAGYSARDKSKSIALPELKRVIVAFGNRVIMEENLDKALSRVLGWEISRKESASPLIPQVLNIHNLGGVALEHYYKAKDHLRQGNWAGYGKELENLENILKEISSTAEEKKEKEF